MATDVEKLIVVLEAKANAFEKQMAKAANVAAQRSGEIKRRFDELNKRSGTAFSGLDGSIARARAGLLQLGAAFAGVQGIEAAGHLADGYTRFANTLKTAGLEGQAFAQVEDGLFAAANRNGVEVESLGQVYARASRAAKSLGATQAQLKTFVDGVSAAVRIQGTSTAAASDALLQLSQGLGSGVFRAEEFNSVLEGLPVIAQAVANNLDVAGGSVARLRTLIADGKVTSQDFFQAFLKGAGQLEGQAAKATLTLSGAFTVLENQLLRGAGTVDKAAGATAILSGAITYLANNLDVAAVALTVIGTALVSRTIPALFAASARMRAFAASAGAAGIAARGFGALSAALGGPVGIALTALAATFAIVTARAAETRARTDEAAQILDRLGIKAREAAGKIDDMSGALTRMPLEKKREEARKLADELDRLTTNRGGIGGLGADNLNTMIGEIFRLRDKAGERIVNSDAGQQLLDIAQAARDGTEEAVKLQRKLDDVSRQEVSPEVDTFIGRLREAVATADRLRRGITAINAAPEPSYAGRPDREGIPIPPEAGQRRVFQDALSEAGRSSIEQEIAAETERLKKRYEERGQVVPGAARLAEEARQLVETRNAAAARERAGKKKADPSDIPMQDAADQYFRGQVQQRQGIDDLRSSYAAETAEVTFNTAALSKNERDRAVAIETYKLEQQYLEQGVTNLAAYRGEIAALAEARVAANETNARAVEVMRQEQEMWDFLGTQGVTALTDIFANAKNATDAVENLGKALANAALQAALLGSGPFAGLLGTSSATAGNGGLFGLIGAGISGLFSSVSWGGLSGAGGGVNANPMSFGGPRAGGGDVQAGRAYLVGEKRPELFVPGRSGTIIPKIPDASAINRSVDRAGPQPRRIETSFRQTIDLRGANGDETIARIAREEARKGAAMAIKASDERFTARFAKSQKYGR